MGPYGGGSQPAVGDLGREESSVTSAVCPSLRTSFALGCGMLYVFACIYACRGQTVG